MAKASAGGGRETLLVYTGRAGVVTRGGGAKEIPVEALAENVKDFIGKMSAILSATPESVGGFKLKEFEVSAEVSASGKLGLLGSGVEASATGALTFKFQRP
jgi:hypothetical protein